ncbi:hypothetical protein BJ138DRAFT_1146131 [Hygrophoropsis aurantiaca]|uniref:Uncharacterized protein n=1 Tax=Hygrophoropsis aurantiaca TaxID=72124 RepID=A0ACB8AJG1_9AGAM|nr:hypothetical protein BJ138DRAFT_1146131 [Hygrophoropsis aurantiaca]
MPAASSSRRKSARSRREPSSDGIEEDHATQQDAGDDVEGEGSDEEQPSRKRTLKKEKKSARKVKEDSEQEDEPPLPDDDDDDDRIDIQNFKDQPLGREEGAKLRGIAQDWELIRKQIHQGSFGLVKDVAVSLADVMEGEHAEEALKEVDIIMKELLDVDQEMRINEQSLDALHQKLMQGEAIEGVMEVYEQDVKRNLNNFRNKTNRQKYASSENYTKFKHSIFEVQNPGIAIPPINDFIPREDGDVSDDDDEMEMGGVTQDFKCPITLTALVNPLTSSVCGHSFSGEAIRDYLKDARGKKACPAAGCHQKIGMSDLKPDKDLEKRAKMAARRAQRVDDDSDADEVI